MFRFFKLSKRELHLLIICCIIIITLLSYIGFIEPFSKRYDIIKEEIQEKQTKLFKLRRVLLQKKSIEDSYNALLPRLSQNGSDEEKFALFLREVELSSRCSNVYITSLKPINIIENTDYNEYLIRVEAEGELHSLARFLYNLTESEQVISLKQLQISYLLRQEDILQIEMSLARVVMNRKNED